MSFRLDEWSALPTMTTIFESSDDGGEVGDGRLCFLLYVGCRDWCCVVVEKKIPSAVDALFLMRRLPEEGQ